MDGQPPVSTSFVPDADNTRLLRDAFGRFATGVTIVTTATPDGVMAMTANSFASLSLTPPLVLWSPSKTSKRFVHFEAAQTYAIHVLSADQSNLCWQVSKDAYALNTHNLRHNAEGTPVLENCLARFECERSNIHDGGDHVIVVGRVLRVDMRADGEPLTFYNGKMGRFTAQ